MNNKSHVSINATARKSGELRYWETYEEFIRDYRFFLSSGEFYSSDEEHFNKIIEFLHSMDQDSLSVTTIRAGMNIAFTYEKEY